MLAALPSTRSASRWILSSVGSRCVCLLQRWTLQEEEGNVPELADVVLSGRVVRHTRIASPWFWSRKRLQVGEEQGILLKFLFWEQKGPIWSSCRRKSAFPLYGRTSSESYCSPPRERGSQFLHLRLCLVTLPGSRVPSSLHALEIRRQVFSGWADDGGQRQSLVTLRRMQKKTQIHTWTRSLGTVSGR